MLVSGDLKPSDHFWCEGATTWQRFITEPPATATLYPYLGDDRPFYFIRGGLLYGPRTADEIDALHASEWLGGDALITLFGAEQWWTLAEFLELSGGEADGFDLVSQGVRAFVTGDVVTGTEIGIHAVKRAFAFFADPEPKAAPKNDSNTRNA